MFRNSIALFALSLAVPAPAQDQAEAVGKVMGITDVSVTIRTENGDVVTLYAPMVRRGDGSLGYDGRVIRQLAGLRKGDRVLASWVQGANRRYIQAIERLDRREGKDERSRERETDGDPNHGADREGRERDRGRDRHPPELENDQRDEVDLPEGVFIRVVRLRKRWILVMKVHGHGEELFLRGELVRDRFVPDRRIGEVLEKLREGYRIGVRVRGDGRRSVVQWIFLIQGGHKDYRRDWERKRHTRRPGVGGKAGEMRRSIATIARGRAEKRVIGNVVGGTASATGTTRGIVAIGIARRGPGLQRSGPRSRR